MILEKKRAPTPSKSYLTFEGVTLRALNLITLQELFEKILQQQEESSLTVDLADMARASVVLSVAAMDAYFTDVFSERVVPFLKTKGPTPKLLVLLKEAGIDTKCALELLAMERPYRRIRRLVEGYLEKRTTQKLPAIDELFLTYGLRDFTINIQKLKRKPHLLKSVERIVMRRHKIAHEGDLNAYQKPNSIDVAWTKKHVTSIVCFVSGADELLQKQLPL